MDSDNSIHIGYHIIHRKRYQKAEEEFVAAKLHLHKMEDMKESLTEHLYTIIHENEVRKAKKLEELVNKLELENLEEFEQQVIEESKPPQSPTSPTSQAQIENQQPASSKNDSSVVTSKDQTIQEKQSVDESKLNKTGLSTEGVGQDSPKVEESCATEGGADVQSSQGANQQNLTSPGVVDGDKGDLNSSLDHRNENTQEGTSSGGYDPSCVS